MIEFLQLLRSFEFNLTGMLVMFYAFMDNCDIYMLSKCKLQHDFEQKCDEIIYLHNEIKKLPYSVFLDHRWSDELHLPGTGYIKMS